MDKIWKSGLLFAIIMVLAETRVFAEDNENEAELIEAVTQPVGRFSVINSTVELGELSQGSSVEVRFPFKVEGVGGIRILGVHEDCGCLTSSLRPGQTLEQNAAGEVKVTLDTMAFAGPIDKTILIMTDESKGDRMHRLRIRAKIRRMVIVTPPLVRFDWTKGNSPQDTVVTVRRLAQQSLKIEKLEFNRDNLDVDVQPAADSWQIRIHWKGGVPVQPFQEMIRITAGSPYGNLQIPVLGHVNAKL